MENKFVEDGERKNSAKGYGLDPDDDIFSRNLPVWEIPEHGAPVRQLREERASDEKLPVKNLAAAEELHVEQTSAEKIPEDGELPEEICAEDSHTNLEVESLKAQLAEARADLYNYRQRVERDRARVRKVLVEDKALEFLPVLDNLDRALSVPEEGTAKDVLVGVRMVRRQFLSVLENTGITIIPAEGCAFDPLEHDAVETEFVDAPEEDGLILCELLRGYRTPERVLRAAQVRVGRLRSQDGEE